MIAPELQLLMDQQAVRDITARAAVALDTRRFEDWLDLCTPDILLVVPLDPARPTVCEGRDALRDFLGMLFRYEATTHFIGNSVIEIGGDDARAHTYCLAHHLQRVGAGRTNLRMGVRYLDSFVRREQRWRMSRRDMKIDWTEVSDSPAPPA